jgi:hypothetical protein
MVQDWKQGTFRPGPAGLCGETQRPPAAFFSDLTALTTKTGSLALRAAACLTAGYPTSDFEFGGRLNGFGGRDAVYDFLAGLIVH